MKPLSPHNLEIIDKLCLKCGLCCDGSLFKDVALQSGDDEDRLKKLGLRLRKTPSPEAASPPGFRFPQPCRALRADCRCSVYEDRPGHCRAFECLLFGDVAAGRLKLASAQRIVRKARRLTAEIDQSLKSLGDVSANRPIQHRFQKIARGMESKDLTPDELAAYGDLTQAFHSLNHLLGSRFYRED